MAFALINLSTSGGFSMDIDDASGGEIRDGTSNAYDDAYYLAVGGADYSTDGAAVTTSLGGRNVILPERPMAGLMVSRQIYVPSIGGEYARYLDVLRNAGTRAVNTTVTIHGNLGSDGSTQVHSSSSGDLSFTNADSWFGTDDIGDGTGAPSLAHVLQGAGASVSAGPSSSLAGDEFTWSFRVSIPPGARAAFLTFAIQAPDRAAAQAEARRVGETPDDTLIGLDRYLDEIQNFSIGTPGAPRVYFDAPSVVDEGAAVTIGVTVEDLEMDAFTFSWDTDDDGTFGENEGVNTWTMPAGSTDGPAAIRVGIQASDGAQTTQRYRTIDVVNLAPTITSSPPSLVTSVGVPYVYPLEVDEPAGLADPLTYALAAGPEGMVVVDDGLLTFTATEADVTAASETITVEVSVTDDDEGVTTQTWELTVSEAPSAMLLDGGAGDAMVDAMVDAEVDPLGAPKPPKPPGCAVSPGGSSLVPLGFALFSLGILSLRRRRQRA